MAWVQESPGKWVWVGPGQPGGSSGSSGGGYGGLGGYGSPSSSYYRGGNPYYTGYPGTGRRKAGMGVGTPAMTPEDRAAIEWAFQQSSEMFGKGQDRLAGGQFSGSALGRGAQDRYLNPTGMDPATLERMKSELAAMYSGARKDQLANAQGRASASGSGDSMGAQRLMQQIEAKNAQDLVSAITRVLFQNEDYKLQQAGQAAQLAAELAQLEAAMNQSAAQGYFNREFPIVDFGQEGAGGGYKYLNERGEIIPRQNWTQWDWEQAMRERQRWVASGGGMG